MKGAWRLYFTSNHDENSWNKADFATMPGAVHAPFAILSQTYNRTLPLIYSGQEEPVLKAIEFFEKDPIQFNKYERANFYTALLHLRSSNKAFKEEATFNRLKVNNPASIMAYERVNGEDKVVVVLNLSNQIQDVKVDSKASTYHYKELFTNQTTQNTTHFELAPWGYKVFVKIKSEAKSLK